jgi:hypothetical protein
MRKEISRKEHVQILSDGDILPSFLLFFCWCHDVVGNVRMYFRWRLRREGIAVPTIRYRCEDLSLRQGCLRFPGHVRYLIGLLPCACKKGAE